MTRFPRLGRYLAGAALSLAGPALLAQDKPVEPGEIKSSLVGKKLFVRTPTAGLADFSLQEDGTASLAVGNMSDSGTWRLTDKGYCTTWKRIRSGAETCFTVVRRGSSMIVLNADGSVSGEVLRVQ